MAGTPVQVTTNSFVVKSLPTCAYHQYDVMFTPADPKPQKRQRLIHAMQTTVYPKVFSPRAVYDGNKLLYSSANIANGTYRVHGSNQKAPHDAPGWYDIQIRTAGEPIVPTSRRAGWADFAKDSPHWNIQERRYYETLGYALEFLDHFVLFSQSHLAPQLHHNLHLQRFRHTERRLRREEAAGQESRRLGLDAYPEADLFAVPYHEHEPIFTDFLAPHPSPTSSSSYPGPDHSEMPSKRRKTEDTPLGRHVLRAEAFKSTVAAWRSQFGTLRALRGDRRNPDGYFRRNLYHLNSILHDAEANFLQACAIMFRQHEEYDLAYTLEELLTTRFRDDSGIMHLLREGFLDAPPDDMEAAIHQRYGTLQERHAEMEEEYEYSSSMDPHGGQPCAC
ncbi:hypothetical protein DFH06DRAFT_1367836 [Mycena polygramma]|nr:hypothetical protein DFH06DRAFT_1367836 [Mycena polygramma]